MKLSKLRKLNTIVSLSALERIFNVKKRLKLLHLFCSLINIRKWFRHSSTGKTIKDHNWTGLLRAVMVSAGESQLPALEHFGLELGQGPGASQLLRACG